MIANLAMVFFYMQRAGWLPMQGRSPSRMFQMRRWLQWYGCFSTLLYMQSFYSGTPTPYSHSALPHSLGADYSSSEDTPDSRPRSPHRQIPAQPPRDTSARTMYTAPLKYSTHVTTSNATGIHCHPQPTTTDSTAPADSRQPTDSVSAGTAANHSPAPTFDADEQQSQHWSDMPLLH